jgi:hypothetical protein
MIGQRWPADGYDTARTARVTDNSDPDDRDYNFATMLRSSKKLGAACRLSGEEVQIVAALAGTFRSSATRPASCAPSHDLSPSK